jgi:hypothetical protein
MVYPGIRDSKAEEEGKKKKRIYISQTNAQTPIQFPGIRFRLSDL